MESRDAAGCEFSSNMEASVAVSPPSEPSPSSSSSLCVAPIDLPASESLEDPSSRCPESSFVCDHSASADGSYRSNSGNASEEHDHSSASQRLADQCLSSSSAGRASKSAHSLSCSSSRGLESPLGGERLSNGQADHSSREASASHLEDGARAEQLWQGSCTGPAALSSLSEANFLPEESSNALEQPPHEALAEEDSHCTEQEQELSDDAKREMLAEICKGASVLSCSSEALGGNCSVYLIGTAHVSEESCREVQAAVCLIKPQVVFLELCQKRVSVLQRTPFVVPTLTDMISTWKQGKTNMLGIAYSWFLGKVAAKLDIRPGSEFRAAYEEALACGAKVVLGDRDIQVTLQRTWGMMSMWYKAKFILVLIYQSLFLPKADQLNELIEKLKDADILTVAFEELGKFSPTLTETLINERDMFMSAALQKIAEHHSSIVAVVGRGHVAGITKYWGQDIAIQTLLEIPKKQSILGLRPRTYVVIGLVALASVLVYAFR